MSRQAPARTCTEAVVLAALMSVSRFPMTTGTTRTCVKLGGRWRCAARTSLPLCAQGWIPLTSEDGLPKAQRLRSTLILPDCCAAGQARRLAAWLPCDRTVQFANCTTCMHALEKRAMTLKYRAAPCLYLLLRPWRLNCLPAALVHFMCTVA